MTCVEVGHTLPGTGATCLRAAALRQHTAPLPRINRAQGAFALYQRALPKARSFVSSLSAWTMRKTIPAAAHAPPRH